MSTTIQYGFKKITPENLLNHDTHPSRPNRIGGDKWVKACMQPQLDSSVPEEIAFLFEVARGSLVYSQFFLPLASLAAEQSFRVLEAGARRRCLDLGLLPAKYTRPKNPEHASFAQIVDALVEHKVITAKEAKSWPDNPDTDIEIWKSMVFLRNRFSHHTSQTIRDLKLALGSIEYTAELLNRLFNQASDPA